MARQRHTARKQAQKGAAQPVTPMGDYPPRPLSELLREYFARVGAPSDRIVAEILAKRLQGGAGKSVTLSAGLINQWRNGHKSPSRRQLVEVARFICELSEASRQPPQEPISLDALLFELLNAGRMSFDEPDFVGDALAESQMEARRTGRTDDGQHAGLTDTEAATVPQIMLPAVKAPPFIDVGGKGLCGEIASYVVKLMGAEPAWVATDWENLRKRLEAREVDLIPPILFIAPTRIRDFVFSEPIGLIAGFKAVVPKNGLSVCVDDAGHLNPAKVEIVSIAGEIGQLFCRIAGAARSHEESATHADAGRRLVEASRHWNSSLAVPVLVSEALTCDRIIAEHSTHLAPAELRPEHQMRFPFAFGMRKGDPTLLEKVNVAIRDIKRTGILADFIKSYHEQLGTAVWVDDDVQAKPKTVADFSGTTTTAERQAKEMKT